MMRIAEMFAGIGGMRLGFEQAAGSEAKTIWANDVDPHAVETYNSNHGPAKAICEDIAKIKAEDIPDFDMLLAGFPCQAFSTAGNRRGFADPRGSLFFDVVRVLAAKRPKAFLLENVRGLQSHDKGRTLDSVIEALYGVGYYCQSEVLNASKYGAPQARRRLYIAGFRRPTIFGFPQPQAVERVLGDVIEPAPQIKRHLTQHAWEVIEEYNRRNKERGQGFSYRIPDLAKPSPTLLTKTDFSKIIIKETPAGVCWEEGKDKRATLNQHGYRFPTARECARIMGYPDSFILPESYPQAHRQMGNSVAVPMIKAIAEEMLKSIL